MVFLRSRRAIAAVATVLMGVLLGACGHTNILDQSSTGASGGATVSQASSGSASGSSDTHPVSTAAQLGFPYLATKNTTRVAGSDPVANAAAVALAVFPSQAAGTHPTAVTIAPTDSWQTAVAAASLMAAPFRAPLLLSGPGTLPTATQNALSLLAPTGDSSLHGAKVVRVGDVPSVGGATASIAGTSPAATAAQIATYEARQRGGESHDVLIAPSDNASYAMIAAGYIAESGEPLLYVDSSGVPAATAAQLALHHHPRIFVLGPPSVVPDSVVASLSRYGTVNRISATTAAAESVAFSAYRDPACPADQPCAHIPGSFGWAIRSPGHGFVLINQNTPLDAAAAAALSSSGGYGPQLLVSSANTLAQPVLEYLLHYATPGYNSEGPTAAVYNHAWLIGDANQISESVQAQLDSILEVIPVK